MFNFISYNQYKKEYSLNETYESYEELKDVANQLSKLFEKENIPRNTLVHIKDLIKNKKKFKTIKLFLESDVALYYSFLKKEYPFDMCNIPYETLKKLGENDMSELFNKQIQIDNLKQGIIFIPKPFIYNKIDADKLLHELQHAYDDYRSGGKNKNSKNTQKFINYIKKTSVEKSEGSYEKWMTRYFRTNHELSAYFVQTVNNISFFDNNKNIRNIHDVWEDFKEEFKGYEYMTQNMRKDLSRKFSQYYYKIKEKYKNN